MDYLHHQQFVKGFSTSSSSNGRFCDYNNVNSNNHLDYMTNYQNDVHHQQQQQVSASSGTTNSSSEDEEMMSGNNSSEGGGEGHLRRGPWTVEEDFTLINYIARHGEGRWNSLARCAGLKRTGKSCRLRWLNYLRPDVRRGNITLEEQLLILELHSRWGNRWSKIAQHLPGRTDNEIKNYWRTRVQKHAKQLKCDVNSKQFKDTMRYLWMPRLVERIQAAAASSTTTSSSAAAAAVKASSNYVNNYHQPNSQTITMMSTVSTTVNNNSAATSGAFTPENSSTTGGAASSDSFATQFSPVSDLTDCYNNYPPAVNQDSISNTTYTQPPPPLPVDYNYYQGGEPTALISPTTAYFQGLDMQINGDSNNNNNVNSWMTMMDGGDLSTDNLWNVDDAWFLQ